MFHLNDSRFHNIFQVEIAHALLDDLLNPVRELFDDVKRKALMRLEYEGLNTAEGIVSPGGRYFQDPAGFAMDRYAYYVCFRCKKVSTKTTFYFVDNSCDWKAKVLT